MDRITTTTQLRDRVQQTSTVVIGGGPAGLAMSYCLTTAGVDHVVLERGRTAERWRSQRWDSLRLLTQNWQTRLPGHTYTGPDPEGFMTADELVGRLDDWAESFAAPVHTGTSVLDVRSHDGGYLVVTDRGTWQADSVVIATGTNARPFVPPAADGLVSAVSQLTPDRYKNPDGLVPGGVLVVGASATGVQLASELRAAGRSVLLAVGRHTRIPRRYRGRDIQWWLDRAGVWDDKITDAADPDRARAQTSLQLVGSPSGRDIDLGTLRDQGVVLAGSVLDADGTRIGFGDDLAANCDRAEAKLSRLLDRLDAWAVETGVDRHVGPAERPARIEVPPTPSTVDLGPAGIRTVLWATGFRREYPWLSVPVLDARGELRHEGGVTPAPGLYAIGLSFMRRRKSGFLDGFGADACELLPHVLDHLDRARGDHHRPAEDRPGRPTHRPTHRPDNRFTPALAAG